MEDTEKRAVEYLAARFGEKEAQSIIKAARILAEASMCSAEEAAAAIMSAIDGYIHPKRLRRTLFNLTAAWDRKEAREKLRAIEREAACRFRQHKARESAWTARKRTGQRKREWRGPWRDEKRTN